MMASSGPLNKIERAHAMYRQGNYQDALVFYTEALSIAKTKPQKIALHSNRAACFLKLHDFKKAADECTSVLELDHNHTGALMLRAQTLVTLKEYHSALFDVNRLIELNPSSDVYRNLEARLRTQLSLAPIPESEAELEEEEESEKEAGRNRKEVILSRGFGGDAKSHTVEGTDEKAQSNNRKHDAQYSTFAQGTNKSFEQACNQNMDPQTAPQAETAKESSKGWQAIPKPKGHSALDYARWDRVEDDSSEDEDDDEDEVPGPQYRFRVRTVGVRPVN